MKILIVGKISTHPIRMGNSRLIADQVKLLREMGHDVHYLYIHEIRRTEVSSKICYQNFSEMIEFWGHRRFHLLKINKIRKLFLTLRHQIKYHFNNGYVNIDDMYSNSIHREINRLNVIHNFDCCIVNYFYLTKALLNISIPRKAFLTHDIFTYRDKISGVKVYESLTPNQEARAAQRAQFLLNVQEEDSIYYSKIAPDSRSLTIFTYFPYKETQIIGSKNILFLSGNNNLNYNGLIWFITYVLPLILSKQPDCKLIVGGGICSRLSEYSQHPNIELCGFINSPDAFFAKGDIFINPTFQGTGLKIKTFEGLSYGKYVVAHPHSTIGIYHRDNAPIFSSEIAEEWANIILRVIGNNELISRNKAKIKIYLESLNSYIKEQYNILLQ